MEQIVVRNEVFTTKIKVEKVVCTKKENEVEEVSLKSSTKELSVEK
jgi:hypothetical protein